MTYKIHILIIGILSFFCLEAAATDNRTVIKEVNAVSDIADILGCGKETKLPTFTISESPIVHVDYNTLHWEKKNAEGEWDAYSDAVFTEGVYRILAFWLIDGEHGTTHRLDQFWKLTVDGEEWETSQANVSSEMSLGCSLSPEMVISKQEVKLVTANCNPSIYDIVGYGKATNLPEITTDEGSIAHINKTMTRWWKQNDAEEWELFDQEVFTEGRYYLGLQVRVDGEYGASHVLAPEWVLAIGDEIWHTNQPTVGENYSSAFAHSPVILVKKEVTSVTATSDIADIIGYGNETKRPTYIMSEGSEAHVEGVEINGVNLSWWKKDSEGKWELYEGNIFTEGIYRAYAQVRANSDLYELAEGWTLTVDGNNWETGTPEIDNFGSYGEAWSPEMTVVNGAGIYDITGYYTGETEIFNLQGIIVKHSASKEDLQSLPAGIYIVNGKKIVVK